MYIVGHYITTKLTNLFSNNTLNSSYGIALYLPDFVRCHDWGYENCFSMPTHTESQALIKAHMLGDWYVHFGPSSLKSKRGWAYKRMNVFAKKYDIFYKEAFEKNLFLNTSSRDSIRGFSHTMMEYCIDTYLSSKIDHQGFIDIKNIFTDLGNQNSSWSTKSIENNLKHWGISGNFDQLETDIDSFKNRILLSNSAMELAYRAGVKKFHLVDSPESIQYVADIIHDGLERIGTNELDDIISDVTNFISKNI